MENPELNEAFFSLFPSIMCVVFVIRVKVQRLAVYMETSPQSSISTCATAAAVSST